MSEGWHKCSCGEAHDVRVSFVVGQECVLPVVLSDRDDLHCKSTSVYMDRLVSEDCLSYKSGSRLKSVGDFFYGLFLEGFEGLCF